MENPIIGINMPEVRVEDLASTIQTLVDDGFDLIEYCLSDHPLIVGGEIDEEYAEYIKNIFASFPIKFAAHIGSGLDLRSKDYFDLHKKVLFSSIDLCAMLNLNPLTLHFEEATPYLKREEVFYLAYLEAAEYAAKKGVLLCMENIEVENYTKALDLVKKISHPNFKMVLDTGHLYLASIHFGHPFIEAIEECAPYVAHLHLSDNVGIYEEMRIENFDLYRTLSMGYRIPFGRGDIHLPPYKGKIPFDQIFDIMHRAGYSGYYLCEYYNEMYVPFNKQVQEKVRSAVHASIKRTI